MSNDQQVRAGDEPIAVDLTKDQTVWWCACGRSQNQPYCDGSHKVTDITPIEFKARRSGTFYLCACKSTGNRPLCDGTHNNPVS
ncbi:MAG: CDGSH iron-sulfur domain-containing protein [Pseudomonadota bacterium]